jgi:tol-pal system protein YbgF
MATTTLKNLSRWLLAAGACLWLGTASAGLFDDDEARKAILDLRQRIEAVQKENVKRDADAKKAAEDIEQLRRSMLDLQNQLETMRAEAAKLRGQNEQLTRDVSELQRRQKDLAQGVDERLRKVEPEKVSLDGRDFMADPSEKRDYEAALAAFRGGQFGPAQVAFVDFVKRYPQSGYAPSALFWLGNAQYATRDYKEAITNLRSMASLAPTHAKVPEALLQIANCQIELKDVKAARATLNDLVKKFPEAEAASAAKERLRGLK